MRTVELAKAAAQAEKLRLQRIATRKIMRVAFYAGAGVFGVAALVLLHVVAYHAMVPRLSPLVASIIILVVDLVIAGILGFLGSRDAPDDIEIQARMIRDQAMSEIKTSLALATMLGPVSRVAGKRRTAGLALGALATRLLARRSG